MKKLITRILLVVILLIAFAGVYLVGTGDLSIPFLHNKDKVEKTEESEEHKEISEEELSEEEAKAVEEKAKEKHGEESSEEEGKEDPNAELQDEAETAFDELWGGDNQVDVNATVTPTGSSPISYKMYFDMMNGNIKITSDKVEALFIHNHLYEVIDGVATRNSSGKLPAIYLEVSMLSHILQINDPEGFEITENGDTIVLTKKLDENTTGTWTVVNDVFTTYQEQTSSYNMIWNVALATETQTIVVPE